MALFGYLASALTGLSPEQRVEIFNVSDTLADVCASMGARVYQPRNYTDPVHDSTVADTFVFREDRARVSASDFLVFIADAPSTGSGQELILAQQCLVPIIVVCGVHRPLSRMVSGMPGVVSVVRYVELDDLRMEFRDALGSVTAGADVASRRRQASRQHTFGATLSKHRRASKLSPAELAARMLPVGIVTAADIEYWEAASDLENNFSVYFLRGLASALGTSLSELAVDAPGPVTELDIPREVR